MSFGHNYKSHLQQLPCNYSQKLTPAVRCKDIYRCQSRLRWFKQLQGQGWDEQRSLSTSLFRHLSHLYVQCFSGQKLTKIYSTWKHLCLRRNGCLFVTSQLAILADIFAYCLHCSLYQSIAILSIWLSTPTSSRV